MASTRAALSKLEEHVLESIGKRTHAPAVHSVPAPRAQDLGRRLADGYGILDVKQIVPDPQQPRTEFAAEDIQRLADSLRDKGQLAPIRVRWSSDLEKWTIIAGERRWRAATLAGLPSIECFFQEHDLSPSEILELQLIENLLREDLKPVEQARAFSTLMELNGWNGKQVAEHLRIPRSSVSRSLALLKLPPEIQQDVDAGAIPARSAYELSKLTDETRQRELAQKARAGELTHTEASLVVGSEATRKKPRRKAKSTRLTFFAENHVKVLVSCEQRVNYHEIEIALREALEEVQLRINNNVQLF